MAARKWGEEEASGRGMTLNLGEIEATARRG